MKKCFKILALVVVLLMAAQSTAVFAEENIEVVATEEIRVEEVVSDEAEEASEEIADEAEDAETVEADAEEAEPAEDEEPEKPEKVKKEKAEREEEPEKKETEEKDKSETEKRNKFTKEQLEARKAEYREKRLEARLYSKELKAGFRVASPEVRKEILAEIAEVKRELKEYSIGVFARGFEVDFEKYDGVKPRIENNRTLVPVRAIVESLDAEVEWNGEAQTVKITKGEDEVILTIGSKEILVNGVVTECEVAPNIENGRTLVPLRVISEALGKNVEWDEDSRTIVIEEQEEIEGKKRM